MHTSKIFPTQQQSHMTRKQYSKQPLSSLTENKNPTSDTSQKHDMIQWGNLFSNKLYLM